MEVVPSSEDLKVEAIRDELFCKLVDFLWFLRLAPPIGEKDITLNIKLHLAVLYNPWYSSVHVLLHGSRIPNS